MAEPRRPRRFLAVNGFPPAPRWAWVVMTASLLAIAVLSYLALHRPPPPGYRASPSPAATGSEGSGAPPSETPRTPAEAARVLVVGDGFTAGTPAGGNGAAGWPRMVGADLAAAGRAVTVDVAAADGSGYLRPGADGLTFPLLAAGVGSYDLVVFFGSRHDNAAAADVQAAAESTFRAARAASPDASLLVIGPAWPGAPPPGYLLTNRDAVSAAAAAVGAAFVDPLGERWFAGPPVGRIAADGVHPTDAGHRYLADLIRPLIEAGLPAGG